MTTETPDIRTHRRGLIQRLTLIAVLLLACAASVTWTWNTIVPELSGLARFHFAEGLSIAVTMLLIGALFETGRCVVSSNAQFRHRGSRE